MLYRKVKVYGFILFGRSKYFKNTRTDDNRVSVVQRKEKVRDSMRQAVDVVKRLQFGNSKGRNGMT